MEHPAGSSEQTTWRAIGTSNLGYGQQAQEELRRLLDGQVVFEWLAPNEVFTIQSDLPAKEAMERIKAEEPAFLRHLQPVDAELEWDGELQALLSAVREVLACCNIQPGSKIAIHIRKNASASDAAAPARLKPELEVLLTEMQAATVMKDADLILSLYTAGSRIFIGLSRPEDNLSDWPGGAIRFKREDGMVSRAKFKLLEAEAAFGLDFSQYTNALDVGAAPGGWTSLLLERGLAVTAVDPAKLHPALHKHPRLTYFSKKADQVSFESGSFDLLVCDMSWSPHQMAKLIKSLAHTVQQGGTVIITVKLMHKKALQTVRDVTTVLEPELVLLKAKQLFHNREELTLFLIKK